MTSPTRIPDRGAIAIDFAPPAGVAYQWCAPELINETSGWTPVPASRHADQFDAFGDIHIHDGGLTLCERSLARDIAARKEQIAAAHGQVDQWWEHAAGAMGPDATFVGSVTTTYAPQDEAEKPKGDGHD